MSTETTTEQAARRTKRRYAHELYSHADEGQTRPLVDEVPYLYARAIGFDVYGTGWSSMEGDDRRMAGQRMHIMSGVRTQAFLADALLQGLAGDAAWAWADERSWNYEGEFLWERAAHYGVPTDRIKPYPCGPEPEKHYHDSEPDERGWRQSIRVDTKESECVDCTEEIPVEVAS